MLSRLVSKPTGSPKAATRCNPIATRGTPRPRLTTSAPPAFLLLLLLLLRPASTSSPSSTRWKARQTTDTLAREAKVAGLKSRAAYKLLEIDHKHRIFAPDQTVVDLGYAPGSWSQVAVNRTRPRGRVVGIDVIPAQPPRGASSIQGNFLSQRVQGEVREYVREWGRGRVGGKMGSASAGAEEVGGVGKSVVEMEREQGQARDVGAGATEGSVEAGLEGKDTSLPPPLSRKQVDVDEGRVVDVVLSDMSEPWPLVGATWIKSVSNPYRRMMNTSGMPFRDHAGSMDLCLAALVFCYDTLATGGHFLCKFYQGNEDKVLESRLRKLFEKVHRIKPDSSRKESKEAYFVALRRKAKVDRESVFFEN